MSVPLIQKVRVGAYVLSKRLKGVKRYPLVLMLEPLFKCNLACPGCGKIDYPSEILNKRLSLEQCLEAVDECNAPIVSIPGGEPLIHPQMKDIVKGIYELAQPDNITIALVRGDPKEKVNQNLDIKLYEEAVKYRDNLFYEKKMSGHTKFPGNKIATAGRIILTNKNIIYSECHFINLSNLFWYNVSWNF